ncbi:MAG: hypothetical protein IMZ61_13845 [Planctomycetes bacterium]|nr:hypothetical protein [Chloroflexota bacterium]MBE3144980.1 hypothetical protein [Planctomycetota bacterium]
MVAPWKPLRPNDWISLEQIINDIWSILNQDTTLEGVSILITDAEAAIAVIQAAIIVMQEALAALDDVAGSDTQVQWNKEGNFGANANFTFDDATNTMNLTGTIKTTRLLAGGVTA